MPTRREFVVTAVAGAAAASLPGRRASGGATEKVRVAAILPFSGGLEIFGAQARVGLDLAQAQINQNGGILGRDLDIRYADDQSGPERGAALVREITDNGVPIAIVGPISSAVRDAMMPEILKRKVPLLYATNYEGGLCNRYFFCFNTVPNQETAKILPYLSKNYGNRFFMLGSSYVWPRKTFEIAQSIVAELGGETVGVEFKPFGTDDFSDVIQRIKRSQATVLVLAIPGDDGVTFMRQANRAELFNDIVLNYLGFEEPYMTEIGPITGKGLFVGTPLVSSDDAPAIQNFVARIRKSAGKGVAASEYALTHYNALRALKLGIEKSGKASREAAIDGMAGLTFDSPTGPVTVDAANHHVTLNMFLGKALGSEFSMVEPLGRIAPAPHCPG